MINIPPFDLQRQYRLIGEKLEAAALEILNSGHYIGGAAVKNFEKQFASYVGVAECVCCNSGTDALYLALRALNIGSQDEVITTPFTFIATAETIAAVGATPVFVDIDAETFNLDLELIEAAITDKTKAIVPVHLFGQPVNMSALMEIARNRNLFVIEDCAQATGAQWQGRKVGSIGDVGCFSFYPTKNLGACGDGGAVTTDDPELAAKMRILGDHGRIERYVHREIGINSRLDALQAAILQVKLAYLDTWNRQRIEVAERYRELLEAVARIRLPQNAHKNSVWNQFTISLTGREGESPRDRVRQELARVGVNTTIYYPLPLHLQPVYKNLGYLSGQLPVAERAAREVLSLPMFPEISFEEQRQVAYSLKDCLAID